MKKQLESLFAPLLTLAVAALVLWGASAALLPTAQANARAERDATFATLLPGSTTFTKEAYDGEEDLITAVYRGEGGYVIETVTTGYDGDITLWVGVSDGGQVTGLMTRNLSETWGLGGEALQNTSFLSQFLNTTGSAEVGADVDALSGATVTSRAVAKGVNGAVAYVTGADVSSGATEWGG
jgi:electron transport complex protein RnfG